MSDVVAMDIVIGAKINGVKQGLQEVQQDLAKTSTSAQKVDSSLDALTTSLNKITSTNSKVALSFDDVSAEIFKSADAFNAKWNPVVEQAAKEAVKTTVQINKLAEAVQKFGGGVQKYTSPIATSTTVLAKNTKASSEAAQALQNIGRVAQDLPFGFIGIANNLNPLLESFQRLRATSGSNAAALKALGSSLTGAGGLGLALSAVTAAIQLAQLGLSAWTRGFGASKSATDANSDSIVYAKSVLSDFEKELEKVIQSASQEATKVSILFSAIGSANTSLKERRELIGQLIEVSPRYFQGLEKEKTSYEAIANAVSLYTSELATTARIKALLPEAEKIFKKILDAQIEIQKNNELKGTLLGLSEEDAAAENKRLSDFIRGRTAELVNAKKYLTSLAGGPDLLSEILFGKPDKKDPIAKIEKQVREAFGQGKLTFIPFPIKLNPLVDVSNLKTSGSLKVAFDVITEEMQKLMDDGFKFPANFFRLRSQDRKRIIENFKEIDTIVENGLGDVFEKIAENVGNFKNPFAGVLEIIGQGLVQIGKAVILSSALLSKIKIALNAVLSGTGAGKGIAVGIGLIALGTLLKRLPKFAEGGIATKATAGIFGEAGPEAILPLDRLKDFIKPAEQQVILLDSVIRGSDLVLSITREQRKIGRKY